MSVGLSVCVCVTDQGPALYAYNNGLFDEDDWRGIRMLSQSIKHSDPLKVGHFGIGFKSVFHLTGKLSICLATLQTMLVLAA